MPSNRVATPAEASCLYPDEQEIARLVVGAKRIREWPGKAAVLERSGLPKVDVMMGGRYWPAVRAFLDRYHHVSQHVSERQSRRGGEDTDAARHGSARARS